jgi:hypothetical protein
MAERIPFRIHWAWFIGAAAVGILYIYTVRPKPLIVFKYPTPYNSGKVIYADHVGNCYKFQMEHVKCPPGSQTEPQPIV